MIEFLYYNPEKLDFPLNETITVVDDIKKVNETCIISNSKEIEAEMYAPEINFYLNSTKDVIADKIKNIEKLYAIRSIRLDFATDIDEEKEVGNKLLLIGEKEEILEIEEFLKDDFELYFAIPQMVSYIKGTIGELVVGLTKNGKTTPLQVDQAVWFDALDIAFKQNGVYDPTKDGLQTVVSIIKENIDHYSYKKTIGYNPDICQHKDRVAKDGSDICGDCANICPTNAIVKADDKKELEFTLEDCERCGGCVSVCPSGALDFNSSPRDFIYEASNELKGYKILILPEVLDTKNLNIELPANTLPLAVGGRKFLHEAHFITLFQQSGAQVVFYTNFISKGTKAAIDMVNEISQRRYAKDMVLVAMNEGELQIKLLEAEYIDKSRYSINQLRLNKREIFAARLSYLIGDRDLGVYKNENEYVHYGKVIINEENCTLCLSCVGACNVKALTAHPEDNTLRFNASICTDCGYCEIVCPESNCIEVIKDEFDLNPTSFKQKILAKDELFKCVECGKEFAPKKAVMKIAQMMTPMFGGDEVKIRTLYCCETCKARVMLKAQIEGKV